MVHLTPSFTLPYFCSKINCIHIIVNTKKLLIMYEKSPEPQKRKNYDPPTVTIVEVSVERGFAATLPDHGVNPW